MHSTAKSTAGTVLPSNRDLYYDGSWHQPAGGYLDTFNPATGENLGRCADANAADVDAAVRAAHRAFQGWRATRPRERSALLRQVAGILRAHAEELALLDSINCGNPVREMLRDVATAAEMLEFCAGLVTEVKGETTPVGAGELNMSIREPYGVVARIVAYNHPLMFTAGKIGAALAVGNTVLMKPPSQAPLSSYRLMELIGDFVPPGVINVITAGRAGSEALVEHPQVPRISLIGSVPTGRAIARAGANRLKHVTLELGGKNACVIYPDANLDRAAQAAVDGMNFTWCGQSCGSTSRLFLHDDIHDEVLARVVESVRHYRPGIPTDMETTMGAIISAEQFDKIMAYIHLAQEEGARLLCGGKRPSDPGLAGGWFVEPTVFADVRQSMRIAREEVFGPVLSVIRWNDESTMLDEVNQVEYGLTSSIWTSDLAAGCRAAACVETGSVWINGTATHYNGSPFGGYKQSGIGREESLEELLSFTQVKNISMRF